MSEPQTIVPPDGDGGASRHATDPRDRGGRAQPMLIVRGLKKHFPIAGGLLGRPTAWVRAVDGVSFELAKGETLGIVGESGCGKSTTARLLMQLIKPDAGDVIIDGEKVSVAPGDISVQDLRRQMQMVFQDSYASLNPRLTITDTLAFGLKGKGLSRPQIRAKTDEMLDLVGLAPELFAERYPHELSGGQRQRVNIARALVLDPRVLILDEAVSALDKSVEAQVLNLLQDLKAKLALTYIFISHDLNVVRYISDRVLVMYLGKVVEIGPVGEVYADPLHPYTRGLFASRPSMNPRRRIKAPPLIGDPPNPIDPPSGCPFRTRCELAEAVCAEQAPELAAPRPDARHAAACHALVAGSGHSRAAPGVTAERPISPQDSLQTGPAAP